MIKKISFLFKFLLILLIPHFCSAGTITVTSPNGGENWNACTAKTITWTGTGNSNFYNIDYSLDNGASWTAIATSYQSVTGSYTWNLPNISSVNCLIRVTDALNTPTFDVSNSAFIINGSLIVLSPNGSENYITGTSQNITYSYISGVVNNIKIEYTFDAGVTWNTVISSTPATGNYVWTIPNTPCNNKAKIRLTDITDPGCKSDTSNANFSITSSLIITAPNGGESFQSTVGAQGNAVIMNNAQEKLNTANFYDDGGLFNNYSTNSFTKTVLPDFPTNKLKVTFQSFSLETGDILYVYDGTSTSSTLLATISGASNTIVSYQATNVSGALTFRYQSDGDGLLSAGWDAYITSIGTLTNNITWGIVGTSKYYNIDYSINSGSTWTRIITNYYSTTGIFPWQVPNTPTTQARVRVTDATNNLILDQSDADFTIIAASPFFIVRSPNGGESVFPNTNTTITWNSAFAGLNAALEYSTNNGSSWNTIINSIPNISESYTWLVPNTPSTQCLIRVKDASNSIYNDVSNSVFTILPFVTVTAPNGGGTGVRCSAYTITWSAGGTSGTYNLDYSADGGTTWTSIVSNLANAATNCTYSWLLPNVLTSQLRVRVRDVADSTKGDISDAGMNVTLPASPVQLVAPNGNENWITGTSQNITYSYGAGTTFVALDYSVNNGASWTNIVTNTTANGLYNWTVPNFPSDSVLVRVTGNQFNGCDYDISDTRFKITSNLVVTQPNGAEVWQATVGNQGTTVNMSNATLVLNTANYYDNGGIASNHTTASYSQTILPDNPLNKLKVSFDSYSFGVYYNSSTGVTSYATLYIYNATNGALLATLNSSGSLSGVTSTDPSGGLLFVFNPITQSVSSGWKAYITSVGLGTKDIKWNIVGTSKRFDLDYSINSGSSWTRIVSDQPSTTGIYPWQVPNTPTTQARVRVRDAGNNTIVDQSDADFTINAVTPVYVVTAPNGGEVFYPTNTATIAWYSAFVSNSVTIEYSINNGASWLPVVSNYPNNFGGTVPTEGTYAWTIPNTPSTQCLVRVKDASNNSYLDVSNNVFTISPYITVTAPNGGETGARCSAYTINWRTGGTSTVFNLDYTLDGGQSWTPIISNLSRTTTLATYSWILPNVLTSQLRVRVRDVADSTKGDISDAGMNVTLPASPVQLVAPNGNENWITGTSQNITYSYGAGTTLVTLDYSVNNGASWTNIVTNTTANGLYNWTVPNFPSDSVLVRVTGNQFNGCDYDISDSRLKITSNLVVTQPNGAEVWQATVGNQGNTVNMSNATLVLNTANYYDNGGIAGNYTATSYSQTILPDNPLNKLKVSFDSYSLGVYYNPSTGVTTYANLYIYNATNGALLATLNSSGSLSGVTSTDPSGGLLFVFNPITQSVSSGWKAYITSVGLGTKDIKWNIVGTSKRFDLDYSINAGSSWTRIISDQPSTTGIYAWQVPNTPTTQARVRVRDAGNNTIVDQSDANFTIAAATPFFILKTPNGSERYYTGQTQQITWQAPTFNINSVKIELSTNNGATWSTIVASTQNTGTYSWTIPSVTTPLPSCRIRISKVDESYYYDVSDNVFEIRPGIVIISPNANSSLFQSCTQSSISWQGNASTNCKIELSQDSGLTWSTVNANFAVTSFNNNYTWNIPNSASTVCLVRVTDLNNSSYTDMSDSVFSIKPSIVLNYPSNGGVFQPGTTIPISWTPYLTSSNFNLDYSTDNGVTWTAIVTNQSIPTYTYNWVAPALNSNTVKIRVTDFISSCKSASSLQPFSIRPVTSSISLTSLNSGTFSSCSTVNINWTTTGSVSLVNLLYSKNSGQSWNLIATNVNAALNTYSWILPNIGSTQVLVKVVDAANQDTYDVSDNQFTINQTLAVTATSNVNPTACAGDTVLLTSSSVTNNLWSNGATTQSIKVTSTGGYYVTVTQSGCVAVSNTIPVVVNPKPAKPVISADGPTTFCASSRVILQSNIVSGNTWLLGGQTTDAIIVNASGNYAVMNTNSFGCSTTSDPLVVTVIQPSTSASASSNSPVFIGETLKLYAQNIPGATYSWSGPGGFTSALQNPFISNAQLAMGGVYTVTATISGCQTAPAYDTVAVVNASLVKVSGNFTTPNGDNIPTVSVGLSGTSVADTISTNAGLYDIFGYSGKSYTLTPTKNNDISKTNGVSTLDIIKIQSHILHTDTLNSPYKIIAADVNHSNSVTNLDILYLRRFILGTDTSLPGNNTWAFVDAGYTFPDNYNPFPYPSVKNYNSLSPFTNQNFKGVKLGDVTYDWDPLILRNATLDNIIFQVDTVRAMNMDTITVKLDIRRFVNVKGLQYTFGWTAANMKFYDIVNNPLNVQFGKPDNAKGLLSMQWNDPQGRAVTLHRGDNFLTIRFIKLRQFTTDHVQLNSFITPIEGYNDELQPCNLLLQGGVLIDKKSIRDEPYVQIKHPVKIYPNPTEQDIYIDLISDKAETVPYRIVNLSGKVVVNSEMNLAKGANHILLNLKLAGIHKKGVYFISFPVNNKMVLYKIVMI